MHMSRQFKILNLVLFVIVITYTFHSLSMKRARSQDFTPQQIEQINQSTKLLFDGIRHSNLELVEQALKQGADVNAVYGHSATPLTDAAFWGNLEIVKMLLAYGANVDAKQRFNETALMVASSCGYLGIVKELVCHGADVNTDDRGFTALMWASSKLRLDIVKLLLQFGVDVNTSSSDVYTALSLVMSNLYCAENICNVSGGISIMKYLVAAGADWQSALEISREGEIKFCQQYGGLNEADEQRIDEQMRVAAEVIQEGLKIFEEIFAAAKKGDVNQIIEFINQDFTLYIQDEFGNTPLHYAIRNNDRAMTDVILHLPYGQRLLHRENNDGQTPMHLLTDRHELLQWILAKFFGTKRTVYEGEVQK